MVALLSVFVLLLASILPTCDARVRRAKAIASATASAVGGNASVQVLVTDLPTVADAIAVELASGPITAFAATHAFTSLDVGKFTGTAFLATLFDAGSAIGGPQKNGNSAFVLHEDGGCSFGIAGVASGGQCSLDVVVNNNLAKWTCTCDAMTLYKGVNYPYKGQFPGCAFVYPNVATATLDTLLGSDFDQLIIRKNGKSTLSCKEKGYEEPVFP